jgi:prevent-host-death family protein
MVMIQVNVFEMKAKLSEYLDRAAKGERIVVCRHNKPVAELRAIEQPRREPRPIGPLPGRPTFEVPASFFEPLSEEELDLWDGTTSEPISHPPLSSGRGGTKVAEGKVTPPRRQPRRGKS